MSAYIVYFEQIQDLLRQWSEQFTVYVPAKRGEFYDFVPWTEEVEIAWDYDLAYNSLKRFFLPPREDLVRFDLKDYSAEPVIAAPKNLLFGVHPYDIKAINQLDQLMETGSLDVNYRARRDATIVFGLEPQRVAPVAFWSSVGSGRVDHGFDLFWTRIGTGSFYVEVGSSKGEELLTTNGRVQHHQASLAEREAARRERSRTMKVAGNKGLQYPWQETSKLLAKSWDSPLWKERARDCLSCGSCVMVCPTCYCFDIQDDVDDLITEGRRSRTWDGCMLTGFSSIAGGHNFRAGAWQRYRHRYFKKGKYVFDKLGELGCVGCGRCVRACTADIANPMAIYNQLWEDAHNEK
ncbi:MAG: 4Fe-4S dicluster domain-containing protein [Desulfovibrionales bacterium]